MAAAMLDAVPQKRALDSDPDWRWDRASSLRFQARITAKVATNIRPPLRGSCAVLANKTIATEQIIFATMNRVGPEARTSGLTS